MLSQHVLPELREYLAVASQVEVLRAPKNLGTSDVSNANHEEYMGVGYFDFEHSSTSVNSEIVQLPTRMLSHVIFEI